MDTNGDTKMLLLKDLCSRLPYGVKVNIKTKKSSYTATVCEITRNYICIEGGGDKYFSHGTYKPYLRSISLMTEEEKRHISKMTCLRAYDNRVVYDMAYPVYTPYYVMEDCLNYLRSIHVDYSGLIEKGLALESPEGMYE